MIHRNRGSIHRSIHRSIHHSIHRSTRHNPRDHNSHHIHNGKDSRGIHRKILIPSRDSPSQCSCPSASTCPYKNRGLCSKDHNNSNHNSHPKSASDWMNSSNHSDPSNSCNYLRSPERSPAHTGLSGASHTPGTGWHKGPHFHQVDRIRQASRLLFPYCTSHNHSGFPPRMLEVGCKLPGSWVEPPTLPAGLSQVLLALPQPAFQHGSDYNTHHHIPKMPRIWKNCRMPGRWLYLRWQLVKFS